MNYIENIIEILKRETDKQLFIFGAGNIGIKLGQILTDNNVVYEGYVVDDQYFKDNMKCNNKTVYPLSFFRHYVLNAT